MRKIALDYGEKKIGIAYSDIMGIIASGYDTLIRKSLHEDLEAIANVIKEKQADTLVVGLPINMDGTHGERVDKTHAFCEELKKVINIPIVFIDERLTTVSAEKLLISASVRREKRKTVIDKVAAMIILQSYLDKC